MHARPTTRKGKPGSVGTRAACGGSIRVDPTWSHSRGIGGAWGLYVHSERGFRSGLKARLSPSLHVNGIGTTNKSSCFNGIGVTPTWSHSGAISRGLYVIYRRLSTLACLLACLPACMLACLHACMLACLHACMLACTGKIVNLSKSNQHNAERIGF